MARILYSERPYVEELSTNKTRNLIVICERLFLPVQADAAKLELAGEIAGRLIDEPQVLLWMLQSEAIDLLFELWEQKDGQFALEPNFNDLQQLRYLGFIHVEEDQVAVNIEAKDLFYFNGIQDGSRLFSGCCLLTEFWMYITAMIFLCR